MSGLFLGIDRFSMLKISAGNESIQNTDTMAEEKGNFVMESNCFTFDFTGNMVG